MQRQQHHDGPAEAQQQTVGAGHVRGRVLDVLGFAAGAVGEVEVDRVLGEHGDHGEDRDGEAAADVDLRGLGRPGEREGGGDDGRAEQHEAQDVGDLDAPEPHHEGGQRHEEAEQDGTQDSQHAAHHADSCAMTQPCNG